MSKIHTFQGTVYRNKEGGVLIDEQNQEEYPLDSQDLLYLMHNDIVKARLIESKHRLRVQIVQVVKRARHIILGQVLFEKDQWLFVPEDKKIQNEFVIDTNSVPENLNPNDMVYARIIEFADAYHPNVIVIEDILGPLDNPGIEIEMAVAKYQLPHEFTAESEAQAASLPHTPDMRDYKNRVDLRDLPFVTIDGADARDFDDAVYACPYEEHDGNDEHDANDRHHQGNSNEETHAKSQPDLKTILDQRQKWIHEAFKEFLAAQPKKRGRKSAEDTSKADQYMAQLNQQAMILFPEPDQTQQFANQQGHQYNKGVKTTGKWRLLVAIADVAHYVTAASAIDQDAITRATSVYFPRKVIPMLPEKLSNGLCSLNPHVDRLVMVCDMVIENGEVQAYQFYEAVIHSAARLTYDEVWSYLGQKQIAPSTAGVLDQIKDLYEVFLQLLAARKNRGAIDFESQEMQIICNDYGKIEKIVPKKRNQAHQLIEECMLAANVCAADFISQQTYAIYRIHDRPQLDKIQQLRQYLQGLGLANMISLEPKPSEIAALTEKIKNRPDVATLQTMILRSMAQAIYHPDNIGHYGLSYGAYTHFTSPIRRYPDLLVHRSLKKILQGKNYQFELPKGIKLNSPDLVLSKKDREKQAKPMQFNPATPKNINPEQKAWYDIAAHSSYAERRADEASSDVQAWLKCYFMHDKVGEVFDGKVASVTQFGLFILLDELWIEGLIHISELGSEYFIYQEKRQEIVGQHTGRIFKVGTPIRVRVARVDVVARKIDFVIESNTAPEQINKKPRQRHQKNQAPETIANDFKSAEAFELGQKKNVSNEAEAAYLLEKSKRQQKNQNVLQKMAYQEESHGRLPKIESFDKNASNPTHKKNKPKRRNKKDKK
jgi:VacB/RNase II family 3'-5' exoribonuclease